jgi:uncharacterized protein (DUF4213/DUF364 family)
LSIASDLVHIAAAVARRVDLPVVRHIYIPDPTPQPEMKAAFGLVVLADNSTGFFYVGLDNTRERLKAAINPRHFIGSNAMELATWFDSDNDLRKPLGLGAINAISQHLFRLAGYRLEPAANSTGVLACAPTGHVGMVGWFPSLVERLRRRGVPLTVIEKKPELVQAAEHFEVTLDPAALGACTTVLCTASTLLNDTLDTILAHCHAADHIAVIGPTAGCLPDPLFARGVDLVGGAVVKDPATLLHRVQHNHPWGDAVEKYSIQKTTYPGVATLLGQL